MRYFYPEFNIQWTKPNPMFLTASNIVHYLLPRGVIDPIELIRGRFKVIEIGRRNRNFKILLGEKEEGVFVKQVKLANAAFIHGLQNESDCYHLAASCPEWVQTMPRFLDFDHRRSCLCLELQPKSQNLREYLNSRKPFPITLANSLGAAMAACHLAFRGRLNEVPDAFQTQRKIPWILNFRTPPTDATKGSLAFLEFLEYQTTLFELMTKLASQWRRDGMIHGDLKWDNCVVYDDEAGAPRLKLIDWELCDIGDSRWDVGGVLQAFPSQALLLNRIDFDASSEEVFAQTCALIAPDQPAISAMWESYVGACGIETLASNNFLIECIEFAAARLVVSAYEWTCLEDGLHPQAKTLLLLAQAVQLNPQRAAKELFGLSRIAAL